MTFLLTINRCVVYTFLNIFSSCTEEAAVLACRRRRIPHHFQPLLPAFAFKRRSLFSALNGVCRMPTWYDYSMTKQADLLFHASGSHPPLCVLVASRMSTPVKLSTH